MFSLNNRREVQQGLYNLYTRAVDRLPPRITALFIATVTGIFAVAAVSLYLYNRVTPLPPTNPTPPPAEMEPQAPAPLPAEPVELPCSATLPAREAKREPRPAMLTEAQIVKKRQQNALKDTSKNIDNKKQELLGLKQQFDQLAREISDWSATYPGEIAACHEEDPRHRLCVAILRALSPTISDKKLRQVTGSSPSPSQSLARLIHNPFSKLAQQSRERMKTGVWCWWNWKERADVIREISREVLTFPNQYRTPKSSADEASVMEYVDEEFRPFIENMFDEIVAARRANALANSLMRKLGLNESDRLIIKASIEQFSEDKPFDYPLLPAVRHNPFSQFRKHEGWFTPYNVRDREALMQRILKSLINLLTQTNHLMTVVDPEFQPCIKRIVTECWADVTLEELDLCDDDQPKLARIAKDLSATHLAELMEILDNANFPDDSYDPRERCPLASYRPTAQAFCTAAKSPLVQQLLEGDLQWVAFIKRSFLLAHIVLYLKEQLELFSSEYNDYLIRLQENREINTIPFINILETIGLETTRARQELDKYHKQLSPIIPER